jgi:hypothetical protein
MSTTIVDDLQRATTAINDIQSAIERKTAQSLDNVPVEDYDDIIRNDMPSLKVNEHTKQTIRFMNELTLDDNTTAEEINNKIDYSNMFQKTLFNNDSTDEANSSKQLTIELDITDNRTTQGPIEGTIANFMAAFRGLQGKGLTLELRNIASYFVGHSDGKFEDASFAAAFEKVNENLTLDDCDGKILIISSGARGVGEEVIATSDLEGVLRNAKGIYTSKKDDDITLDLSTIFALKASNGYARVNNMLNGFTAPNTIVVAPGFDYSFDVSTDEVTGHSEYANMNVNSLNNVDLGYKNNIEEMYDAQMGRSRHTFYNSTISKTLSIIDVPGSIYYKNNSVPVSDISSFLDLADVWDAIDFSTLASAYDSLLQSGSDYQEGSTFTQGNVVVYKYADQQLSGDESAITDLGVTIVDIPRA